LFVDLTASRARLLGCIIAHLIGGLPCHSSFGEFGGTVFLRAK
jgi:hypothetical protein